MFFRPQIWQHGKAAGQTFDKAKGEVASQGVWCARLPFLLKPPFSEHPSDICFGTKQDVPFIHAIRLTELSE